MFVWFQLGWAAGGDNEFSKFGHQIMWMFNLPTLPYILSVHIFWDFVSCGKCKVGLALDLVWFGDLVKRFYFVQREKEWRLQRESGDMSVTWLHEGTSWHSVQCTVHEGTSWQLGMCQLSYCSLQLALACTRQIALLHRHLFRIWSWRAHPCDRDSLSLSLHPLHLLLPAPIISTTERCS